MKVFSIIGMIISVAAIISGAALLFSKTIWQGDGFIILVLGILAFCYFGMKLCESITINKLYKSKQR